MNSYKKFFLLDPKTYMDLQEAKKQSKDALPNDISVVKNIQDYHEARTLEKNQNDSLTKAAREKLEAVGLVPRIPVTVATTVAPASTLPDGGSEGAVGGKGAEIPEPVDDAMCWIFACPQRNRTDDSPMNNNSN